VYLDKGENDGLKKDMAVITADGVVGKILQVYPHTAQVLLINDQTSGLGAIVERLRQQCIVKGSPAGETMLENIMADEDVQPGDSVITTGGDGIFPKGLPVGQVVKVSHSDLFLRIHMRPAADLSRLEEVLVITKLQEVAFPAGEVAGSQRAVDILAARLPGVPVKDVPMKDAKDGKQDAKEKTGTHTPETKPANPAALPNASAKPQVDVPLPTPKPPKNLKPAAASDPAGERTQ